MLMGIGMVRVVFVAALLTVSVGLPNSINRDRPVKLAQSQTQTYAGCVTSCNTQYAQCTSPCYNTIPGTTTLPSTANSSVGTTTNQTQCFLNCTSQQLVCQQRCSGLQ